MWSSWYQSEPGPSTVENRAQTECSTLSRTSRATVRSVSDIDCPLASFRRERRARWRGHVRTVERRPRDCGRGIRKIEIVEIADRAAEARGQRRDVGANPVRDRGGHGQRRIAAGFTVTSRLSGSTTACSRTRSSPPQPPAPWISGILGAIAISSVSASRQAEAGGVAGAACSPGLLALAGHLLLSRGARGAAAGASAGRGLGNGTDA